MRQHITQHETNLNKKIKSRFLTLEDSPYYNVCSVPERLIKSRGGYRSQLTTIINFIATANAYVCLFSYHVEILCSICFNAS